VTHNLLFSPPVLGAARLIESGRLGRPHLGHGEIMGYKRDETTRGDLDWRASRAMGGGCVIDTAYHEIYTVEALVGSPVRYVEARVATLHFDIDVDDTALLLLEHANGALSTVEASWCARAPSLGGRWVTVNGPLASVRVVYSAAQPLSWLPRRAGRWEDLAPETIEGVPPGIAEDSTGHAAFLVACIQALDAGAPPPVSGAQGRHNLAIVEAARQSSATRRAVEVVDA
jgi:predicted dehydrogenase